jgi:enoyl-CoA hydratase/carnithine racemase
MEELSAQTARNISSVTVDWPPNNHVNTGRLAELADTLENLDDDPSCRVVVLRSNGRVFCAGADPREMRLPFDEATTEREVPTVSPFYAEAVRLYATRKPIVVAVQGAAVGAGLGLALVGDFRVASCDAWFSANFVSLGFHPGFGLTHTLPRLIGGQRAAEMFLTGKRVSAHEALEIGLVDRVVPAEVLQDAASTIAEDIAANGPLAVQATRATLRADLAGAVRRRTELEWSEQRRLIPTADFAEGITAKIERRKPVFTGR